MPQFGPPLRTNGQKAHVIAVDMGYGHQRAAYPLHEIAYGGKVVNANNYRGIPEADRKVWQQSREFYEFISRFKSVPLIGNWAFDLFDKLQQIPAFYPKRDLSISTLQVNYIYHLIRKNNWGKHLIDRLEEHPLPLITTFFVPAFMAEYYNYSQDIYCLATDTDIGRSWVPPNPASSRIVFFAPSYRVQERLKLYGVPERNIYLTGFPLPTENLGGESLGILRKDLSQRLANLDPEKRYLTQYKDTIMEYLGERYCIVEPNHILTLTFAVGGAGAQRDIAIQIATSLKSDIKKGRIRLILVAGIHNFVFQYFKDRLKQIGLGQQIGTGIKLIHAPTKEEYFKKFDIALRTTDILWTKPSELSFYTALGLPIIMSPPIGSQEDYNRKWLMTIGSGIDQDEIKYTNEWLFDWLNSGWFAEAAMNGYMEAPKYGTYNIEKIINKKYWQMKGVKTICQY